MRFTFVSKTLFISIFASLRTAFSYAAGMRQQIRSLGTSHFSSHWRTLLLAASEDENLSLTDVENKICSEESYTEMSAVKAVRYFINLTNGIEAVSVLLKQGVPMEHINSTHCEMRNYEGIIENLDYNLLMSLALGYVCVVYDYGCRGNGMDDEREGIPRAFWWGTEWIRYVLDHFWHLEDEGKEVRMVRGYNSKKVFESQIKLLPKDLKRRIKYFRVFLKTNRIHLYPLYSKTDRDGEREYYAALLQDSINAENPDLGRIQKMARVDIDAFVQSRIVDEDMHIYRSTDFEGFGRAKGYGIEKVAITADPADGAEAGEQPLLITVPPPA